MDLKDKVVIVTGGAQGIGAALCRRFATAGARGVVVADRNLELACTVAQEIDGTAMACDVAQEDEIGRVVEQTVETYGPVDLFCSNAGIFGPLGGLEATDAQWRAALDVNFMAHVYAARAVVPAMCRRGQGYLVQMASAAGLLTHVGAAPYSVTKHAAVAWAEWLALSYREQGLRVSCICPLGVRTEMLAEDAYLAPVIGPTALSADQVAKCTVEGVREERFLILPHAEVGQHFERKATQYDRWLRGMAQLKARLEEDSPPSNARC